MARKKKLPKVTVTRLFFKFFSSKCYADFNKTIIDGYAVDKLPENSHPLIADSPAPQKEPEKEVFIQEEDLSRMGPKDARQPEAREHSAPKGQPEEHEPKENTMAFYMKYNCSTYKELEEKSKNQ